MQYSDQFKFKDSDLTKTKVCLIQRLFCSVLHPSKNMDCDI